MVFRFLRKKAQQKNEVKELMNEVSKELGVEKDTQSINQDPKEFATRMKKEISKRT